MKTLISWLLTCTIILSLDQVCCRCSISDHSSLLKFNSSASFTLRYWSYSENLKIWNASSDCCIWEGVSCDQDGHVTHLDVSSNGEIKGTFNNSNSVFRLQHLKTLHMFSSFTISSTIQNLTMFLQNFPQLEELYLGGVDLSNEEDWCGALSASVPKLKVLSLTSCRFSGPLEHSLLSLQSLSLIDLSYSYLNCPVPISFANFSNLISLQFPESGLHGTFPREIFHIPTLQTISLSDNEFLKGTLPEFPINNSLQSIDLSGTEFSGKLPSSVGNLWNLSSLGLSDCQFYGPLPSSIQNLTHLEVLSLSNNKFTGPIPSFSLSKNLSSIDLSENRLDGEIVPRHFEGLSKLNCLSLSSNSLKGSIPSSLFSLPSLEKLYLSNNQLKCCEIPNSSVLDSLSLSGNNLDDFGSVMTSITKLENISSLDLSHNNFGGTIQLNVFQGFRRLDHLDISYNRFSVDVSDHSLESIPRVTELSLASCNLREFPNFKNRLNLSVLDLSNNQISGEIPNWVWEFKYGPFFSDSLRNLNLSHNNLVSIQEPYSFPSSLTQIDLHSNRLQGKISISHFPEYADFSSNNLSSIIQTDNNNRVFYSFLSLSNNSLTGDTPKSVCLSAFYPDGAVLDLSRNKLSGIGTCLAEASKWFSVLNLRKNNLRGPIPDAFPRDCGLQVIDLNGNFIDGEIPKSLANCTQLKVLDLGRNNLTGEFPCFLKNISTLKVLILRANNLHGSIECPDSGGSWPVLQILDIAQNQFSGELGVKWLENLQVMKNDTLIDGRSNILGIMTFFPIAFPKMASGGEDSETYGYVGTTVTLKGQERELEKILTIQTLIDLSSNNFNGLIPKEFGELRALTSLNLSNNALTGEIPSSLGNLRKLESLDLSRNHLNGTIPASFGGLSFLQFMNLSFNQLTGKIPEGGQIQTFPEDFFIGNEGLCGFPSKKSCSVEEETTNPREDESSKIDWNFLSAEIGFIVGLGAIFAPIVFFRRLRVFYFDRLDDIVVMIFPWAFARKWLQLTNT